MSSNPFRLRSLVLAAFALTLAVPALAQQYPPYPPPPPPPQSYPTASYPPQSYPQRVQRRYSSAPQPAAYAMFSAAHYSGQGVGPGTAATQSGGITALGGTFGLFAAFPTGGPVRAGIDGRLIVGNSANSTPYGNKLLAGLVGVRIDGSGARTPVIPYFQLEVGGAGTNSGTQTTRTGSFAYQAQFGVDIPFVVPQLAGRVEYGAGQLTSINNTNHTLQTFAAGIVFHFN